MRKENSEIKWRQRAADPQAEDAIKAAETIKKYCAGRYPYDCKDICVFYKLCAKWEDAPEDWDIPEVK